MSEITRRDSAAAPAQMPGTTAPAAGAGRDVDQGEWSGDILRFAALSADPPESASLATMARLVPGARRRGHPPGYFRRRIGWWADRSRVVTAISEQRLMPQPDGRFRPVGEWSTQTTLHLPVDVPNRRVGDVPHDSMRADITDSSTTAGPAGFEHASSQVAFLPEPVRRSVAARVPSPVLFEAQAIRHSSEADHPWHTIRLLKMDGQQALVVQAARQPGAPTWQVEQIVYDLRPRPQQLPV